MDPCSDKDERFLPCAVVTSCIIGARGGRISEEALSRWSYSLACRETVCDSSCLRRVLVRLSAELRYACAELSRGLPPSLSLAPSGHVLPAEVR